MLAIVDISKSKPLLYQFTWKVIKFIENKKTKTWMRDNRDSIAHLPMVFMAKIHQMFVHLANFSQNFLNTNKVELGNSGFDTRLVKTGVRLGAKFINKMIKHVEDNVVPKEIPNFKKSLFVKQTAGGIITFAATNTNAKNQKGATISGAIVSGTAISGESNKRKSNGNEPGKKKFRKEFSDMGLKMELFHTKKGTPATKALPKKGKLKDEICLDFCTHEKSATIPISFAAMENTTQTGRTFLRRINPRSCLT
jgi:hypothetical protein